MSFVDVGESSSGSPIPSSLPSQNRNADLGHILKDLIIASLPTEEPQIKAESTDTPFPPDQPFSWGDCSGQDIVTRVFVKQRALDDALKHASCICEVLKLLEAADNMSLTAERPDTRCGKGLLAWKDEIEKLQIMARRFEVLIGVAGRTGAGKSSILNMLLGILELLPSSNSEAATSCACRVSWNDDDDPAAQFKAEIVFRSYGDVREELLRIYDTIRQHRNLDEQESDDEENGNSSFERMEEIAELRTAI
ncbi:uncharacterized protein C8A04DRAFT_24702 [Dichotomopilus funicola]|uniref:Dynamin N-terminal domain-containing protein n=1 Tax=Dichotomopilus funicola TaxID=1934379 RepID=A0AAN6V9S9_9PEZI|nr:hypothetical protein C8A04DRAFT_24702 [Dichotomopilus funicola]